MDKKILIKYFKQQTTEDENRQVVSWFHESEENKTEYASLKNIWALASFTPDIPSLMQQKTSLNGWGKVFYTCLRYAAVVAIAILSTYLVFDRINEANLQKQQVAYNEIVVPRGQQAHITLSDGTKVWLNAKSKLKYPASFTGNKREVALTGEAYFDVRKDAKKPFIVKTYSIDIKVLGTRFNLSAYNDDKVSRVALDEGSVSVYNKKSRELSKVKPGELFLYDKRTQKSTLTASDLSYQSSWKDGELKFRRMRFEDLSKLLERNYNVKFVFKNEKLRDITFNGSFYNYESIDSILKVLEINSNFSFVRNKETVYIE